MTQQATNLLANGQTAEISTKGRVVVRADGAFGSGALALQAQDPADLWHPFGTPLTADGVIDFTFPDSEIIKIRTDLTGATSPDIDVWVNAEETRG